MPVVKMNAKERVDFHRPAHGNTTEKQTKGGLVTDLKREYWLDKEGKLNYKTWVGVDGKPLKHSVTGQLTKEDTKAIKH